MGGGKGIFRGRTNPTSETPLTLRPAPASRGGAHRRDSSNCAPYSWEATMHPCIRALILVAAALLALPASTGSAQTSTPASEIDQLKQELRRMQERLQKLEQAPPAPAPAAASTPLIPVAAQAPPMAPRPGEREILLDREHPLEALGLSKPELGGVRFSGFFVGSANYNSRIQMVPEFAGSTPVSSEPNRTDFRFDQFTFGAYKTFAPWLWAGASP